MIATPYTYKEIPKSAVGHADALVRPARLAGYHIFTFKLPERIGRTRLHVDFIVIEFSNKGHFKRYYLEEQIEQWLDQFTPGWEIFVWTESFDILFPTLAHATAFRLKWLP